MASVILDRSAADFSPIPPLIGGVSVGGLYESQRTRKRWL
jgi:hypothetical protein